MSAYYFQEPSDGDAFWGSLSVGDSDPTSGGVSYPEQKACLWDFRPHSQYRCTREHHTDPWHVASDGGRIVALFCAIPTDAMTWKQRLVHKLAQIDSES